LKNLLSNAFKFTEQGSVSMRIRMADQDRLLFSVADTGIGIAEDKQSLIFEAFQQADGTTSRRYGGTGLGLTISREIARLLGGHIEVKSTPGSGSTFNLYIPPRYAGQDESLHEVAGEGEAPLPELPKDADFSGKKILVVDDDKRNIFALSTLLENHKMAVIYAENGRSGIQRLIENPDVDIVLMDIMMPEVDGIQAIQEIRNLADFKDLPIISVTAKAMKGDREKSLKAGANDYITKPVDPERLLSMMYFWLNKEEQGIAS
jgi:CheY-like chemotaxis protein